MDTNAQKLPFIDEEKKKKRNGDKKEIVFLKNYDAPQASKKEDILRNRGLFIMIPFLILCYATAIFGCVKLMANYGDLNFYYIMFIFFVFTIGVGFTLRQQYLLDTNAMPKTLKDMVLSRDAINHNLIESSMEMYEASTGRYITVINAISGILTTLGIVGTILGLTLSMSGLKELVSSAGNSDAIAYEMNNILSGVDVSFYTTLFGGFLGGITLKICNVANNFYLQRNAGWLHEKLIRSSNQAAVGIESLAALDGQRTVEFIAQLRKHYMALAKEVYGAAKSVRLFDKCISELPLENLQRDLSAVSGKINNMSIETLAFVEHIKDAKLTDEMGKSADAISTFEKSVSEFSMNHVYGEMTKLADRIKRVNHETLSLVTNIKKMMGNTGSKP